MSLCMVATSVGNFKFLSFAGQPQRDVKFEFHLNFDRLMLVPVLFITSYCAFHG